MFKKMRVCTVIVGTTIIALSGCVVIGGSKLIGVRGMLPESAGECLLEFTVAETGRVKMTQPVQGEFGVRFHLNGGVAKPYYFVARCPDGKIYRSEQTKIGMSDEIIQIDLFPRTGSGSLPDRP